MTDNNEGLLPIRRRVVAVIALSLGSLMLMIDASIAGVVLPTIAIDLGVKGSATLLVVTVYQLILAMTLLPLAAIGERFGYRRLYQAGFVLHATAGILCLLVDTLPVLIAVRAMQSLGSAMAMAVAVALVRSIYPAHKLGSGLALNTIANASGTALAPMVGGFIVSVASWQWAFAAVAPLSLLSLLFSRALPDPVVRPHAFDLGGALLCALTFGLLIAGLEATVHTDHVVLSLLAIVAGAVVAWFLVRHEKGESRPVLPVDLLAQPVLAFTALATFCGTLASMALILFMPFRLQHGYGFSPAEIGTLMAAYALASVMISPLAGVLSDRIAVPILATLGMVVAVIGLSTVALLPSQPGKLDIAWRLWLCGVGFGFFFSPNARFLVGSAPTSRAAAAGSLFTTMRMLAMAAGATLVAFLLAMGLGDGPIPPLVAACLALVAGAISATGLRQRH